MLQPILDHGPRSPVLRLDTSMPPRESSSPGSSASSTSAIPSLSKVTGREAQGSTTTKAIGESEPRIAAAFLSPPAPSGNTNITRNEDFQHRGATDESPSASSEATSPSAHSMHSLTTDCDDFSTPGLISPASPLVDHASIYDDQLRRPDREEGEEWSSPDSNSRDGITPRAEVPPPVWSLSKATLQKLQFSQVSAPNLSRNRDDTRAQLETRVSQMSIGTGSQAKTPTDEIGGSSATFELIKRQGGRVNKCASLDKTPPKPAKAVGSYFPIFGNLESHPTSPPAPLVTTLSEQARNDAAKRNTLATLTEGVVTQTPTDDRPPLTAASSSTSVSSAGSHSPSLHSLHRSASTDLSGLPISRDLRRNSSASISSVQTGQSRVSSSGCSISSPKLPPAHYPYVPGRRSSSANESETSSSSQSMSTSLSSTGSERISKIKSKPVPPTPKWATPPLSSSSAFISGIALGDQTEDVFAAEFDSDLFSGHEGEWVDTMKAEEGRVSLLSFKRSYVVLIWLPGFSFEDIVVSARNKHTLHVVADQWDVEDHAQWDVKLGEDADMGSIKANIKNSRLQVTITRELPVPVPLFKGGRSTSFSVSSSSPSALEGSMARIGSRLESSSRSLNLTEVKDDKRYTGPRGWAAGLGLGVLRGEGEKESDRKKLESGRDLNRV